MAYSNAAQEAGYVTRLLVLRRLSKGQEAQCEALRQEAGRCWSDLVTMHKTGREQGQWISVREMEQRSANGYALHSQTIQALTQRLDTNLQTAKVLRERQTTTGVRLPPFDRKDTAARPRKSKSNSYQAGLYRIAPSRRKAGIAPMLYW